jgi:hypothetical protein
MARSPASFVPYVAVTSTPAFGISTWNMWVAVVEAGSAASSGRAAVPPPTTMAEADVLAGWMSSASVRPRADAGQSWPLPGVPR